jgi:hypothetical protein
VFLLRVSDLKPGTMESVRAGPFGQRFGPNNFVFLGKPVQGFQLCHSLGRDAPTHWETHVQTIESP